MPYLVRTSEPQNIWGPIFRHTDDFQPPQYIQNEIDGANTNFGVDVFFNGTDAKFYRSCFANAGRVTFRLEDGWHYISQGGNAENLNRSISEGMEFRLQ